jgi:hydroxymethylpyrimidine/phosphomethylpyrimidine kinase
MMKDAALERGELLGILTEAVGLLAQTLDVRLIPPKGVQLGYSVRGARDKNGVAAVNGGIVAEHNGAHAAGTCGFGVDEDIARIILTAMRFDPDIRCAATLRGSVTLLRVIENLLLECRSFEVANTRPGISTMDWGVASCCKDGVPDVCYPKLEKGNEFTFLFFGEDPVDVANNIIMISNRIINIDL